MKNQLRTIVKTCLLATTLAATLTTSLPGFGAEVAPVRDTKTCEPPKYPRAALLNEESGTVKMVFLIDIEGNVLESKIDVSSGSRSLDKATLAALMKCKFIPGTKNGKKTQLWSKVEFVWMLE
jgi:protein TonB